MLNTPDLIRIKYRNMRIFPGDFIHGGVKEFIASQNLVVKDSKRTT